MRDSQQPRLRGASVNHEQHRSVPLPFSSGEYRPTFNLFRHKRLPDLLCAVPEDHPVPAFVTGSSWTFAGTVSETYGLVERNWRGVEDGVNLIGFYLFHSCPVRQEVPSSL